MQIKELGQGDRIIKIIEPCKKVKQVDWNFEGNMNHKFRQLILTSLDCFDIVT